MRPKTRMAPISRVVITGRLMKTSVLTRPSPSRVPPA